MRRINLMPQGSKSSATGLKGRPHKILIGFVALFIFILLWQKTAIIRYGYSIKSTEKEIQRLQEERVKTRVAFDRIKEQREKINTQRNQIAQRTRLLQSAKEEGILWSKALLELGALTPEEIRLNKISLDKKLIILTGAASKNKGVSTFMSHLDQSSHFSNTSFNFIQKSQELDNPLTDFEVTTNFNKSKVFTRK